jgi:hypothetical protein
MQKNSNPISTTDESPRTFTYDQLLQISDENYEKFNRCMDMSNAHADDVFVLHPALIHCHAFGEEAAPHLRTSVTRINETETLAFQDVTFEQWDQGKEIHKVAR